MSVSAQRSWFQEHHFLLRRLHSLSGVIPIGLFVISHLMTNGSIVWGVINRGRHEAEGHAGLHPGVLTFQHEVNFIHSLPFLILIEIFGLWLPIAFHSILGIYYARSGKSNVGSYAYQANWRYTLQRVSGYLGVLFIFYHVATLRWGWTWLVPGGTKWSGDYAASTLAAALQGSSTGITIAGFLVSAFYMLGVSLLVFHLANGLWTTAITWGLTISRGAQRRWGFACAGIGAGLMALAWSAVIGFATLDVDAARAAEDSMLKQHGAPGAAPASQLVDSSAPGQGTPARVAHPR